MSCDVCYWAALLPVVVCQVELASRRLQQRLTEHVKDVRLVIDESDNQEGSSTDDKLLLVRVLPWCGRWAVVVPHTPLAHSCCFFCMNRAWKNRWRTRLSRTRTIRGSTS